MKRNDDLEKYFHKRIKSVLKEIEVPRSKRTSETFHRLRVEIKKIKALFALIGFTDKKFKQKKSFESFKELFKVAGEFRVIQLEEKLINKYDKEFNVTRFIASLEKRKSATLINFEKQTGKLYLKEIEGTKRKIKCFFKSINEKDMRGYNKKVLKELNYLTRLEFKKGELHETRKKLKEFLYNLRLSFPKSGKLISEIDILQDNIGKWHDNDVASQHLRRASQLGRISKTDVTGISKVLAAISSENDKLLKRINAARQSLNGITS